VIAALRLAMLSLLLAFCFTLRFGIMICLKALNDGRKLGYRRKRETIRGAIVGGRKRPDLVKEGEGKMGQNEQPSQLTIAVCRRCGNVHPGPCIDQCNACGREFNVGEIVTTRIKPGTRAGFVVIDLVFVHQVCPE